MPRFYWTSVQVGLAKVLRYHTRWRCSMETGMVNVSMKGLGEEAAMGHVGHDERAGQA